MHTFIIRDYPDLDHIFPIMHIFLIKKKVINVLNFEINLDLDSDERIIFLKKKFKKNINIIEIYTVPGKRIFLDKIINFVASKKFKKINFKNVDDIRKNHNFPYFIFSLFICFLKKIIFNSETLYENFFFSKKWAENIFIKLNISTLVLDDSYYFNYARPQSLIQILQLNKKKIILVPHTCHMFERKEDINNLKSRNLKHFYPKIVVTSNRMKNILNKCGIKKDNIFVLGSARFSPKNIKTLKNVYKNKKIILNKNKINILYIDGAYDNVKLKLDLLSKINKLGSANLIIKPHPRGIFSQKQKNSRIKNFQKKLSKIQIDLKTPTRDLIYKSDLIIGTYSSVLVEAMLIYKKMLLPRFLIKKNEFSLFYENYGFSKKCNSIIQAVSYVKSFNKKKSKFTKKKYIKFINEYVYGNLNKKYILDGYYKLISSSFPHHR